MEQPIHKSELRVLVTTNIPAPYMVDYLNELGKYCHVTALFEIQAAVNRETSWYSKNSKNFSMIFLHGIRIGADSGLSFKVLRFLSKNKFDRIIIANPTTPTGIISLLYCRWFKIPFILQSEGGFQGTGRGVKEQFKKYLMEKAELFLTGMGGEDDYFLRYGADAGRLRPYCFTSLHHKDIENKFCDNEKKQHLRKEFGMSERIIILYVGSFFHLKGIDVLLHAIQGFNDSVGLYLVGGEPTKEYLDYINNHNLNNVHFVDFSSAEIIKKYYLAADIFALPTRRDTWGLVVNEAMANGLPVVVSDMCIAGRYLVQNGVNGYVVPVDDPDEMHSALKKLVVDQVLRQTMAQNSIEKIQAYSIENMAKQIFSAIAK